MQNHKITLACRNYDRTQAIIRGLVKIPGIDLPVIEMSDVPKMFTGLFKGEFDASEMSLAEPVYYTSRSQSDFIGVPVFPSKRFESQSRRSTPNRPGISSVSSCVPRDWRTNGSGWILACV